MRSDKVAGVRQKGLTAEIVFFQGNRDESYDVDEALAEQDATALFEVTISVLNSFMSREAAVNPEQH